MKKLGRKMAVMICLMLFVGLSLSPGVSADWQRNESSSITKETGSTDILGGGDYVYIKFKNDAGFGVLYGTEDDPNSIIILAWHTRYLGGADVYDENGALIGQRIPIPVVTVFAQKLEDIFEFNDTDGDGIADYKRSGSGLFYFQYPWHEPIYKMASLETAWERSDVTEITDPDAEERTWEFSLTATNLSYKAVGDSPSINYSVEHEALDRVEFTFHLTAGLIYFDNVSVPYYRVTVREETRQGHQRGYTVMESERVQDRTVSGKRGIYTVKYDHEFEGWDYDPTNENPMLLMEFHAILGVVIPEKVAEWIKVQFLKDIDGHGKMEYATEDGKQEAREDDAQSGTGPMEGESKKLRHRYIRCGDNWENIGNLTWVSNVTVDGQEKEMYAQVQGHVKFAAVGPMGNAFVGFALLGGFSYPGGTLIYHDPAMAADSLIEMSFGLDLVLPLTIMLITVIIAVVVFVTIALYSSRKSEKEDFFKGSFESYEPRAEEIPPEKEFWENYYGKR